MKEKIERWVFLYWDEPVTVELKLKDEPVNDEINIKNKKNDTTSNTSREKIINKTKKG